MNDMPERISVGLSKPLVSSEIFGEPSQDKWQEYIRADLFPQWHPIETAPKEAGSEFLVWRDGWDYPVTAAYDEASNSFFCPETGFEFFKQPTHWMPLPIPPNAS